MPLHDIKKKKKKSVFIVLIARPLVAENTKCDFTGKKLKTF